MFYGLKLFTMLAVVAIGVVLIVQRRAKIKEFFSEVRFEMTKVSWPATDDVINSTILIFVVTIVLSLQCMVTDSIFAAILREFYR